METLVDKFKTHFFKLPLLLTPKESYNQIVYILFFSDLIFLRFFIAQSSIIMSFLLFFPENTLDRPVYFLMRAFLPETTWAWLFLFHGLFSSFVQIMLRRACIVGFLFEGILGCVLWNTASLCMVFGVYPPPIFVGEYCIAFSSWLVLARYDVSRDQIEILEYMKKIKWKLLT